jgi:methyl-accepting chemotaxis protein
MLHIAWSLFRGKSMQNVTVRSSLLIVLCLFTAMIIFGAGVGVFALNRANTSTFLAQTIAANTSTIVEIHKETVQLRSSLMHIVGLQKEGQDVTASLNQATTQQKNIVAGLETFERTLSSDKRFGPVEVELVGTAQRLLVAMQSVIRTLGSDADAGSKAVDDLQAADTLFAQKLTQFQGQAQQQMAAITAEREQEYRMVVWLVTIGMAGSLLIVVGVHVLLRRIVLKPLNDAVVLLDRVASGDLTTQIGQTGKNEIGRLFAAMKSMQQGLSSTVSRVRASSDSINASAGEIAMGNADLSSRTELQAGSLEETASSMEELTSTVSQNAENAYQANELAKTASQTAVKGGEAVRQVVKTMDEINESSKKIGDIVGVIDGIAFQTNILALNAAVEAARAGEQGRGFAVVASEVRSLAQRSAAAAREVKHLINVSVERVSSGNKLVEHAGVTMDAIVDSVHRVGGIVSDITIASREQSDGITQTNEAIAKIDGITHQNAALVEQASAAALSLQEQAETLAQAVSVFRINPQLPGQSEYQQASVRDVTPAQEALPGAQHVPRLSATA